MITKLITENNVQYIVEIYKNGTKCWYLNGNRHRDDGPVVERADGSKRWYLNGKRLNITSNEQFKRIIKLKAFL